MIVTKICAVTKQKFQIYIDEEPAFMLYKGELSRYHISVGESMEKDIYDRIYSEVVLKRAKQRALYLLNAMGRTEVQLREKLRQDGYGEKIVNEAVSYVKSFGYINDELYAETFIDSRKEKKSRKELYMQLKQKGLSEEIIDRAFEACYEKKDAQEAIAKILEKKKYNPKSAEWKETQKIMSYLIRKGFVYEDIKQVIQVSEWNA